MTAMNSDKYEQDEYDETIDALNRGARLPDVRRKPKSSHPTYGVVIIPATAVGILWQQSFEAFPHYQPLVHLAAMGALVLLSRWASSE